jgi:catechol 2,3-dioxygenase-like lactoylglutathione lyase family enzyme
MLQSLDHVLVAVRDLEAATRATAALLGRRPSWRGEHPREGTANTLFRLENTYLELIAPAGEGRTAIVLERWLEGHGEGPLGLAFGTDDAEASRLALAALDPEPVEKGLGRDVDSGAFREWRRVGIPLARTRGVLLFAIEHTSPPESLPPAPLATEEAAAVHALDHAVVQSRDPDATRALYGDGLGLRLALDRSFEQWGARLLFFRVGGVTVEIAAQLGEAPEPEAPDRLWGLSYRVGDADAARARLLEDGFDVSEVRTGRRPGTRVFTVRGEPCGVATLMLEVSPQPAAT